jgi:hypothetical protein
VNSSEHSNRFDLMINVLGIKESVSMSNSFYYLSKEQRVRNISNHWMLGDTLDRKLRGGITKCGAEIFSKCPNFHIYVKLKLNGHKVLTIVHEVHFKLADTTPIVSPNSLHSKTLKKNLNVAHRKF